MQIQVTGFPEFVGRLPIIVTLDALDEAALIEILTKPKNALVKQYKTLMEMDDAELEFEDEALAEIAREALQRGTGARGLRSILERTSKISYTIAKRRRKHERGDNGDDVPLFTQEPTLKIAAIKSFSKERWVVRKMTNVVELARMPLVPLRGVKVFSFKYDNAS